VQDELCEYYFKIRPDRISLFRFILEGYDGLATLSTRDAQEGLVKTFVPKSRIREFQSLMASISAMLQE